MKLWTCVDHDHFWPTGCASIVLANNEEEARKLLDQALVKQGLRPGGYTLQKVSQTKAKAIILEDGEY